MIAPLDGFHGSVFFEPTAKFLDHVVEIASHKRIIDAGAGAGRLSRLLRERGCRNVIAIDLVRYAATETPVEYNDAISFDYRENDLVIIARPCQGDWIEATIRKATTARAEVLYVTRPTRIEIDIADCVAASATRLDFKIGDENEIALKFTKPPPHPRLQKGEALVQLEFWHYPSPVRDGGDRWINTNGCGWRPKSKNDKIILTYQEQENHSV